MEEAASQWRAHVPAVVIGFGLGGSFDGIVLHQVLQWHHLVSNRVAPYSVAGLEFNYFVDGLFHQAMWIVTLVGVFLLYMRLVDPGNRRPSLVGGTLVGFGLFNVADAVVFHWLLGLHNIRSGPASLAYDVAFFGWGVGTLLVGGWSIRRRQR